MPKYEIEPKPLVQPVTVLTIQIFFFTMSKLKSVQQLVYIQKY